MPRTTTGSSELDALARELKSNYKLEKKGSGHFRVVNRQTGKDAMHNGKAVTLTGTAHGGRAVNNMRADLKGAGVLKGEPRVSPRYSDETKVKRNTALRKQLKTRQENRQKEATALHDRIAKVIDPLGGWEMQGMQADLAHIGALVAREQGKEGMHPDHLTASAFRVHNSGWIEPRYQEVWNGVADRLENADDLVDTWFALVREARGIPEEQVTVRKPQEGEWPFRVELIPVDRLFADHDYQRPVAWPFVRKLAQRYDESLVGTIDVSERKATFAILDGQLRYEASKLVGKTTLWCSIYEGLDKASEARFFLHKNRDRKAVHPYYTFMARVTAEDPDAIKILERVKAHGYRISATSAAHDDRNISAIAALEQTQKQGALEPVLTTLKGSTYGRTKGQDSNLIRGLGYLYAAWPNGEVDQEHLQEVIANRDVPWLLGRAREGANMNNSSVQYYMARVLVDEYNRGRRSVSERLSPSRLFQR